MKASSSTQPSVRVSIPEAETGAAVLHAIRYPIHLSHDTLANRFAALREFAHGLPEDQLPVAIEFVGEPV